MLPEKALFWKAKSTLILADLHIGKVSHFRKAGVRLPESAGNRNLVNLDKAIQKTNPEKILVLGDLFHSKINSEWYHFSDWLQKSERAMVLVKGNHDILESKVYREAGIKVVSPVLEIDNFIFSHYPLEDDYSAEGKFCFAGHIHPSVKLEGKARQSYVLPCFWIQKDKMILPAFGSFTGSSRIKPGANDLVYIAFKEKLHKIC